MLTLLEQRREAKNRRIAAVISALFWAGVLLICLFTIVWSPPDPPIPQYGIMVNFGTDEAGDGKIQNRNPSNNRNTEQLEEAKPRPVADQTQANPTPQPKIDPITPTPVKAEEATPPATEDDNSPDVRPEKPQDKPQPKPQPKPEPKPNPETTLGKNQGESGNGNANQNPANNNGNVKGATGDQGRPDGDLNSDALLGGGGGGGSSYSMTGWRWDAAPQVADNSSDTGTLTFEVKIDDEGEVISVKLVFRSVSREVANLYEKAIWDLTFSPLANNPNPPPSTTGRVTFKITNK